MERLICVSMIFLGFLAIAVIPFCFCYGESNVVCHESEKKALLRFKQGLEDSSNRLTSWVADEDCCKWEAVGCDNITGHVIKLNLRNSLSDTEIFVAPGSELVGEINSSLLELKHLNYLDLSGKLFENIPVFFGSLKSLRYLILARSELGGVIPYQLSNLTNLLHLDLSEVGGVIPYQLGNLTNLLHLDLSYNHMRAQNLGWLSHLSSLEYLNMNEVELQGASDWLQVMNTFHSLVELHMRYCMVDNFPPFLRYVNFKSLAVLDLSGNNFTYTIPMWFYNLSSLSHLDLGFNILQGQIPDEIGYLNSLQYLDLSSTKNLKVSLLSLENLDLSSNMNSGVKLPNTLWNLCSLEVLDLSYNNFRGQSIGSGSNISTCIGKSLEILNFSNSQLTGHIPASLGNLYSLRELNLGFNKLHGSIPETFGLLSNLETLYVQSNALDGVISEAHFTKLSKLKTLVMSLNSFTFTIGPNWLPPFQLEIFEIIPSKIVTGFPAWLCRQNSLHWLDLSNTGISDLVPNSFWNFTSQLSSLNLSNNQLQGDLSNILLKCDLIDLSSNRFNSYLPRVSPDVVVLILSKNSFSGSLSPLLCESMDGNRLTVLDLSENLLSGQLPHCWMYWRWLTIVNLGSNNLIGNIPSSMGSLYSLQSIRLQNNNFSGDFPSPLQNCTDLRVIDLGENMLSGNIPRWMGEKLKNIIILRLRSNKFRGSIPQEVCNLNSLQVLDLAHNSLSEAIPLCLDDIDAMVTEKSPHRQISYDYLYGYYNVESLSLVTKGSKLEYKSILGLLKSIDLSSNNLYGGIPHKLSSLSGLRFLNLSWNYLNGNIPENIDGLKWLESLDFLSNHLSGAIPQSLSSLTFLSFLNFSCNNLSGRIPLSTQLQSFSEESYAGNLELCGVPLSKKCAGDGDSEVAPPSEDNGEGEDDGDMLSWFYISIMPGFVVGFWGVCGVLYFKKSWRYAYFGFLDNIKDGIYVAIALKLVWLQKKAKRNHVGE